MPVYAGGSPAGGSAGPTLRVVTFNLKWGRAIDRAADLFTRPGPLRDADLVVLEEMDRPGTERLAGALGMSWVYVPSAVHPVPKQDFGVALLSPWPLEEPRKLLLPHLNRFRKLRRSAAVATLRSPLGPVRVYGVHLESPAGAYFEGAGLVGADSIASSPTYRERRASGVDRLAASRCMTGKPSRPACRGHVGRPGPFGSPVRAKFDQ